MKIKEINDEKHKMGFSNTFFSTDGLLVFILTAGLIRETFFRFFLLDKNRITHWLYLSYISLGLLLYIMCDLIEFHQGKRTNLFSLPINKVVHYLKLLILSIIICLIVIFPTLTKIELTHQIAPISTYCHDTLIQIDAAIRYILSGKNPYTEDYTKTPLPQWGLVNNPALYHFCHPPFILIGSIPFYLLSINTLGWYDQRFLYLIMFCLTLCLLYRYTNNLSHRLSLIAIFALNPLFVPFLAEGRTDIFVIFWLVFSVYLLKFGRIRLSCFFFTLACLSKQTSWIFLPFYFVYMGIRFRSKIDLMVRLQLMLIFVVTSFVMVGPFLFWDMNSFFDDTISFIIGTSSTSYPIRGSGAYGFGTIVLFKNWVNSPDDYFPFWIFQLIFCLPLLYYLIKRQINHNTISQMWINYGIMLFTFQYFSRFFHDNYIGAILSIIAIGFFANWEKDSSSLTN